MHFNSFLPGVVTQTVTGTSQLLSVPYAFHANTAETISEPIVESDPLFEASPAAGIEAADIGNWDEAYSRGDHAVEGYLTEESDPLFTAWDKSTGIEITESQISDLGDYLTEESQNLADVLGQGNDADEKQIKNLADPTDAQDAATKAYVDESVPKAIDATAGANGGSGFASAFYWSSTEHNIGNAWAQNFSDGFQFHLYPKSDPNRVRAVRAFYIISCLLQYFYTG